MSKPMICRGAASDLNSKTLFCGAVLEGEPASEFGLRCPKCARMHKFDGTPKPMPDWRRKWLEGKVEGWSYEDWLRKETAAQEAAEKFQPLKEKQ